MNESSNQYDNNEQLTPIERYTEVYGKVSSVLNEKLSIFTERGLPDTLTPILFFDSKTVIVYAKPNTEKNGWEVTLIPPEWADQESKTVELLSPEQNEQDESVVVDKLKFAESTLEALKDDSVRFRRIMIDLPNDLDQQKIYF